MASLVGKCMEMCPEQECSLREKQGRVHSLEMAANVEAQRNILIKEYSRPAAGRALDPKNVRPAAVLIKTMEYLFTQVLGIESPLYYKCEFVSDRIRSVRQDLTAQNVQSDQAIDILEKAVRYYLIIDVQLSGESLKRYDPALHQTHTQECLTKLLALYKTTSSRNQASFEACNLLINLGNSEAYQHVMKLDKHLRECTVLQKAIHLTRNHFIGNFIAVFRAASKLPYLERCAFFRHIQPIRWQGLQIMNTAFSSKNLSYPLTVLADNFFFDSHKCATEFCNAHGINVQDGRVFFKKGQVVEPDVHKKMTSFHKLIGRKLYCKEISDMVLDHTECSN